MNKIFPLKGKKINKLEHIGPPFSSGEMVRCETRINEIKMEAMSYCLGFPLDAIRAVYSHVLS